MLFLLAIATLAERTRLGGAQARLDFGSKLFWLFILAARFYIFKFFIDSIAFSL